MMMISDVISISDTRMALLERVNFGNLHILMNTVKVNSMEGSRQQPNYEVS